MTHPHKKICFQHIEYSKINKYIYIGTNQCSQEHFSKELIKKGICADISLEEKRLDTPLGVKFYLWLPTKDHRAPSEIQLEIGVKALSDLIKAKMKVYIHCKNGHGRAPLLAAAYFIKNGMSLEKAISLLKSKRSGVHFHPVQLKVLKKFEKAHLKKIRELKK